MMKSNGITSALTHSDKRQDAEHPSCKPKECLPIVMYTLPMQKLCANTWCGQNFEVTSDDLEFYERISPVFAGKKYLIPPPTRCPECRQRHRLAFRNNTALFQRPSYPSNEMIFSMYPESAPFPVMKSEDWLGDSWDALSYGAPFSCEQTFMEQLWKLHTTVPRYAAINNIRTENAGYCNNVSDVKNCYLTFATSYAEDCLYGENVWGSKDCVECTLTLQSELCYDCTNCTKCMRLQSSFNSENCSESFFLGNCRNCHNCFGCVNLRNKKYCIWNEQKTKEEYEEFVQNFDGNSFHERAKQRKRFEELMLQSPHPHAIMHQTEDCTGNCIVESKGVQDSYFIQYGEDLKNCFNLYDKTNDCRDFTFFGRSCELVYESCTCGNNLSRISFCYVCRNVSSDLMYCISCDACKNCFGCVGLYRKEYCILNTQYTKEEYEELVPKIINHMIITKEWGEFFPVAFNPMPYNRSIVYRYYPLTKAEAEKQGYTWYEENIQDFPGAIPASELPDGLPATNTPLTVRSASSGRPFKITSREIDLYHALRVPLPRDAYEERMNARVQRIGLPKLYERTCAKTGKNIVTTYPPDSPYIIWDREEYEKEFQ